MKIDINFSYDLTILTRRGFATLALKWFSSVPYDDFEYGAEDVLFYNFGEFLRDVEKWILGRAERCNDYMENVAIGVDANGFAECFNLDTEFGRNRRDIFNRYHPNHYATDLVRGIDFVLKKSESESDAEAEVAAC